MLASLKSLRSSSILRPASVIISHRAGQPSSSLILISSFFARTVINFRFDSMNYSVFMDDDKDNGSTDDVIGSMIDVASSAFYDIRAKLLDLPFPSSGRGFVADVFLTN